MEIKKPYVEPSLGEVLLREDDREIRLFAVGGARKVQHLHPICKQILDVAESYANGLATEKELDDARNTAWGVLLIDRNGPEGSWFAVHSAASACCRNSREAAVGAIESASYTPSVVDGD